jgi:hypothetical protein
MLYKIAPPGANTDTAIPARQIRAKPKAERIQIGADLADGLPVILNAAQAAFVCGVSASAISRRRGTSHRRTKLTLADHIVRATPAERTEAVRNVGPDKLFSLLFEPNL